MFLIIPMLGIGSLSIWPGLLPTLGSPDGRHPGHFFKKILVYYIMWGHNYDVVISAICCELIRLMLLRTLALYFILSLLFLPYTLISYVHCLIESLGHS